MDRGVSLSRNLVTILLQKQEKQYLYFNCVSEPHSALVLATAHIHGFTDVSDFG